VDHPEIGRVLVVEHGDQAGVKAQQFLSVRLDPAGIQCRQGGSDTFELWEITQIEAGTDGLQGRCEPERGRTVQGGTELFGEGQHGGGLAIHLLGFHHSLPPPVADHTVAPTGSGS